MKTELNEEKLKVKLETLYRTYGYKRYKMNNFEEYDLYAGNRNFLTSGRILTFSDTNGKLMALKPDVTLSIVKNTRNDEKLKKIFYTEQVYRAPHPEDGFKEIMQTGLECIGRIDSYQMAEVIMLAAKSLETMASEYVIDVSHMGIVGGILEGIGDEVSWKLLQAASKKNIPEILSISREDQVPDEVRDLLAELVDTYEPMETGLEKLRAMDLPEESRRALRELEEVAQILKDFGIRPNLDFSIVNDMDYYNGVIFRGYVEGIAGGVLSGGRYDNLMERLGKPLGAIGFAVYIDQVESLWTEKNEYDVDLLVKYNDTSDMSVVVSTAQMYTAVGYHVAVQSFGGIRAEKTIEINGREVKVIGTAD